MKATARSDQAAFHAIVKRLKNDIMKKLQNKVALVTGGNSGIGYATAADLVANGAAVIITGRRAAAVQKAADELGATGIVADQSQLADINRLYERVKAQFGRLDILFINAGITGTQGRIEQASEANFNQVMDVNFKGAYFTLSTFIPLLNDGASVVILSSIVAGMHRAGSSIYQASKAALNSVAKTAAVELAERGIRVNIVSPGPHKTEIMKKAGLDETTLRQLDAELIQQIPLRKMGEARDVAQLVRYFSEESASFITGTEVVVDGGLTL